ncbi:LPS export ABC transporter periplasmic protein LptC [Haliea sp. AH-315-K21]|uniref:LPS export ABC transporter periplasmic protein LptC n=1 Tax=SAR86 cluster bacterium TaxID=2030880 RepID=A0A2A5C9Z0_9GAMM|nr:LPS export ABC transporter periplasmic protein LptC [Haliea sp. AH-315-K21]PCJ40622.1 MAG: LPS export ABC transporter periplasmic protein LptC [SAR86 cluster bacterium]
MRYHTIVLAVLACMLFLLLISGSNDDSFSSLEGSRVDQTFDYYLTTVDSTQFSPEGESEYRLQAERIVHYPYPEYATIDSPRLIIYESQAGPWFLSAVYGTIRQDIERSEERLDLSENVVVQHTDADGQTYNIYTDELTIYLTSKYLSTESEILFETMNREISSLGMTADLTTRHFTFLSQVKGRYE